MDDDNDDDLDEDEPEHEPWCVGDCDGTVAMEGGFVTVACGCPCHG